MVLVPCALCVTSLHDVRALSLIRLLKLHQLARVVLLRDRVASWPRVALDAAGLVNRASSINLAADLCIPPKIGDAIAS